MKGIDYAWANPKPSPSCLKQNGVGFIMRYFSYDSSKDLTKDELNNAVKNGIAVGVVWETTANRMMSGYNGGVTDAKESDKRCKSLGITGIPVYFACDWDSSESEQAAINAYLDGAVSVIGKARTGMYGGYHPIKRAFDASKMTYGWQTYAWSGGNWDNRAQLRQTLNGVTVCGTSSDWDESRQTDFGQWPRPTDTIAGPIEEIPDMVASVAWYNNKAYFAYINPGNQICVNGGIVDPHSYAKSGAGIDINPHDGHKIVSYVNKEGDVCTYEQSADNTPWKWCNRGWDAK